MKSNWQIKKLLDVCTFENGDRGTNYPSKSIRTSEGIPFINAGHLTETGIDMKSMNYISRERFNLLSNGKIQNGDILFCLRGSLGKVACVGDLSEGAIASSLVIIRPSDSVLNSFVLAYLKSHLCQKMILHYRNGAAQPNLSAKSLSNFVLPVPPLSEQKRVVSILDECFEATEKAKENAEKNLHNAHALLESTLESVFSRQGEGWAEKTIGDIAQVKGGKRVPKGYKLLTEQTDYPYLRVTDFSDQGTIDTSDLRYVTTEVHRIIKNYIIYSTDLYISIAGTIGKTGIIPKELDGANLTENACRLVFNSGINNRFVYYFTLTPNFVEQAGLNTRTAAQPKLALSRLATIKLGIPSLAEQNRLVAEFDGLHEETQRLKSLYQSKLEALDDLKKSLLTKAFAGEL